MNFEERRTRAMDEWKRMQSSQRPMIMIGTATCGLAAGAGELMEAVQGELKKAKVKADVMQVGCIGACFMEPLVDVVKPGRPRISYHGVDVALLRKIIRNYIVRDDPMPERALCTLGEGTIEGIPRFENLPMMRPQVRIALRNCGLIDPASLEHFLARDGYLGLKRALGMSPQDVIDEIKRSGLRGRGGGGFPTGLKWQFARNSPGTEKYVICNADEGDPGAFMDRAVLEGDPHAVLEGMCIAAYAIGAGEGYIYIRAEYPLAIERLAKAMAQMEESNLAGDRIMGSDFNFHLKIKEGAGAFVCGEETALIGSIEGRRGMPRPRPPFPAVRGLFGKPSNINNVETYANVPTIMRRGADWYASIGTEKSKGTKVFSLVGKVCNSGLIEVPMGIPLSEVIYDIGGGILGGRPFKAAQTGGPSGGCLPTANLDLPIDYERLAQAGSIMGSGGLVVMDEDTCMVDVARYFLAFTQKESCGKCTPCRLGTRQMLTILEDICAGRGREGDIELLEELGSAIQKGSLCGLGQTAPNPVLTTIKYFREEYEEHIRDHKCRAAVCREIVSAPCTHTCPAGIDVPRYVRLIQARKPKQALDVIREKIPFPSVCGLVCFHPCETRCKRGQLDASVSIRALKRFAAEKGTQPGRWGRRSVKPSGRKVAVVGAGPGGLTAAYYLSKLGGHDVTVFEALPRAGGMLRYGIPAYRLPRKILDAEIRAIRNVGVKIRTKSRVKSARGLLKSGYDAVFVSVGAHRGLPMRIKGENSRGVLDCVTFLRSVEEGEKVRVGKSVAVVGGGNAAVDAARTALRLGADRVTILYRRTRDEMPAYEEEVHEALAEGVAIEFLTLPVEVSRHNGRLSVTCRRMELGPVDSSGRRRPVPIDGSDTAFEVDTLIAAIGQEPEVPASLGVEADRRSRIKADPRTMETAVAGLYAGGDAVTGPASVIEAIAAGRSAAVSIDKYLGGSGLIDETLAAPDPASWPAVVEAAGEWKRIPIKTRPARNRIKGFVQVEEGYSAAQAYREACRCLRCDLEE